MSVIFGDEAPAIRTRIAWGRHIAEADAGGEVLRVSAYTEYAAQEKLLARLGPEPCPQCSADLLSVTEYHDRRGYLVVKVCRAFGCSYRRPITTEP